MDPRESPRVDDLLRLTSMYAAGDQRALTCVDVRAGWAQLGGEA